MSLSARSVRVFGPELRQSRKIDPDCVDYHPGGLTAGRRRDEIPVARMVRGPFAPLSWAANHPAQGQDDLLTYADCPRRWAWPGDSGPLDSTLWSRTGGFGRGVLARLIALFGVKSPMA